MRNLLHHSCLWILVGTLGFCGCGRSSHAPIPGTSQDLTLTTSDDVRLGATLYPVNTASPPGLILVQMLGTDRRAWQAFAVRAQQNGYMCIAFDLRGHGESVTQESRHLSYRNFDTQAWLDAVNDLEAAKKALIEHGIAAQNIAIIGASIGANLALHYALQHTDIPAIVLVSPGLDYKGVKTESEIEAYGKRPLLLLTSEGDSYSASSCTTLKRVASGLCELREYRGAAHGSALFDNSENALEQVFLWLNPIIGPHAGS